ncbi:MAG: hypothetical protein GY756_15845 [bacterium]|nr:hypothetical protein [bacterium]
MKNLKNLKGAKTLCKSEQKNVIGGASKMCDTNRDCPSGSVCSYFGPNSNYGWCVFEEV